MWRCEKGDEVFVALLPIDRVVHMFYWPSGCPSSFRIIVSDQGLKYLAFLPPRSSGALGHASNSYVHRRLTCGSRWIDNP